ncbi:MAG: hypothetical protein ACK4Z8_02605 [Novosphingobium sp.]
MLPHFLCRNLAPPLRQVTCDTSHHFRRTFIGLLAAEPRILGDSVAAMQRIEKLEIVNVSYELQRVASISIGAACGFRKIQ